MGFYSYSSTAAFVSHLKRSPLHGDFFPLKRISLKGAVQTFGPILYNNSIFSNTTKPCAKGAASNNSGEHMPDIILSCMKVIGTSLTQLTKTEIKPHTQTHIHTKL